MKKVICFIIMLSVLFSPVYAIETLQDDAIDISAPSAILMEKESGEIIYEKNAHERLAPASVTKVMTMLLIVEAIEHGDISTEDTVTASARAASFGGSCVYLEEGEKMSVDEMLKCICVVSANDCAVAMSEFLCGTEQAFVQRMNDRAAELGLQDTHFCNCTGLFEEEEHYTSAYDIAIMSRELIRHDLIKKYSTIWMDTIRNGEFGLSNTNKLVYYYDGCTGLKTGFTNQAMYCLSATAMRNGVEYIAVIMHADTVEARNDDAKTLLNYGFANYTLCSLRPDKVLPPVKVELGCADAVQPVISGDSSALILKQSSSDISCKTDMKESVAAPVEKGQVLGTFTVFINGEKFRTLDIVAADDVARLSGFGIFKQISKLYIGLA